MRCIKILEVQIKTDGRHTGEVNSPYLDLNTDETCIEVKVKTGEAVHRGDAYYDTQSTCYHRSLELWRTRERR